MHQQLWYVINTVQAISFIKINSQALFARSVLLFDSFHQSDLLSKSESVKFSLIESVICLFTDSSVQKYFSLPNQLIFADWINEKIFFHC